jgi:damage-control phosphatase, subfamily I
MKATVDCRPCLTRLVRQAAERATEDPALKAKALEEALKFLDNEFSLNNTSIYLSTRLHRIIRAVTGNPDPYLQMKETEVKMAQDLLKTQNSNPGRDLRDCLKYAVKGNAIDFFRDQKTVEQDLSRPVEFALDDTRKLEPLLKKALAILYLADNTGEVFFDLPLVKRLADFAPITYVVKKSPVQNDITLADLERFKMSKNLSRVISTGTDTPGVDMAMASAEFKDEFENSDLVIAKGMGYWETLSELPAEGKVFYLLKAKCQPVARSLEVQLNSCVALLR